MLRPRNRARLRAAGDLVTLYIAAGFAVTLTFIRLDTAVLVVALCFPLVVTSVMHARGRSQRIRETYLDAFSSVVGTVSLAGMLTIAAAAALDVPHALGLAIRLWLYAVVYLATLHIAILSVRRRLAVAAAFATPTLIVGAGVIGVHLARRLLNEPGYGLRPVGLVDSAPLTSAGDDETSSIPLLGGIERLQDAIRETGAEHVILAFSSDPDHVIATEVNRCQQLGVTVSLVPRLFESMNERTRLDHIGGLPVLILRSVDPDGWQFAIKHAMDRGLAAVILLLGSPVMLVIAMATKLSSPGPVLYHQRRVGRDGHEFDLLKFRTMRIESSAAQQTSFILGSDLAPGGVEGLDRRTRLGRRLRDFSLDELPQLINVLRGDMSLVGPRPERPDYAARFSTTVVGYERRHRVRSGITGWAQVHGLRGQTSISDRVEWDNYYILNWSLHLDARILAMTVAEILRFRES